jgi:hypothetical protein
MFEKYDKFGLDIYNRWLVVNTSNMSIANLLNILVLTY